MLSTSNNVLFPGHNQLLTTGTDDPTLQLSASKLVQCIEKHANYRTQKKEKRRKKSILKHAYQFTIIVRLPKYIQECGSAIKK